MNPASGNPAINPIRQQIESLRLELAGALSDGMVKVDTEDEGTVTLILNGVDLTYSYQAPIQVLSAEKTVIVLADGL
jgi:hypothetical protein